MIATSIHPAVSTTLRVAAKILLAPIGFVFVLLEPILRYLAVLMVFVGVITATIWEMSAVGPTFPFLKFVAASFVGVAVYVLYSWLLSLIIAD